MSVGKGSIIRAAKSEQSKAKTETKAPAKKPAAKKSTAKKAPAKSAAPVRSAVITADTIHEMKFNAISGIYTELPTYLL